MSDRAASDRAASAEIRVWDVPVRLLHWTLAAAVVAAYLASEGSRQVHEAAALVAVAAVTLRALWGLVGSPRARFDDFVRGPGAVLGHLRGLARGTAPRHLGHNPAGGAMAVALMAAVLATALVGVLTVRRILPHDAGEDLHAILGNGVMVLAAFHLAGVVASSLRHRENLVRAMMTGRKRPAADLTLT
jgi:cytochrome b